MSASLLSKRNRRLGPSAQIQSLIRIGRRALAHADHLEHLLGTYYVEYGTDVERAAIREDVRRSRAKAARAADEAFAIAETSDDPRFGAARRVAW